MPEPVMSLLDLLDLERIEVNLFRGVSPQEDWQRVFGGQVIGQALVAATRTVEDRSCHSLHAYFLRPGDPKTPILYEVERIRDGKSFTTRRVKAIQRGEAIFSMSASFQIAEPGFEHAAEMPDVPAPEDLPSEEDVRREVASHVPEKYRPRLLRKRAIEVRGFDPGSFISREPKAPFQNVWVRATGKLPDDIALHQCVLAYASDITLVDTCARPHGIPWFADDVQTASLDHAMWFHRPFRADEWLLYAQDSPSASAARGFSRGSIFDRSGRLVASVAQEALIRPR